MRNRKCKVVEGIIAISGCGRMGICASPYENILQPWVAGGGRY